ncbi:MAG: hypothetical protein ACK4X1_04055 [Terricaulis sp.]
MAPGADIPLKRVLSLCNVSRATLWRVSRAGVAGFPPPTKKGGRLFWCISDLDALKAAIDKFEGRNAFDQKRRLAGRRAETRYAALAALKRGKVRRARAPVKKQAQGDLFGGG